MNAKDLEGAVIRGVAQNPAVVTIALELRNGQEALLLIMGGPGNYVHSAIQTGAKQEPLIPADEEAAP